MFTIQQDYINQFGININGHLLVLKQIRVTESTETVFEDSGVSAPSYTNSTKNIYFRAETYVSQSAFDSGAQGMPLSSRSTALGGMGDYYFSDASVDENNAINKCHAHLLAQLFPENTPTPVPYSVTRRQALQQLTILGVVGQIDTIISNIVDPAEQEMVRIFWNESTSFERSNPYIIMISDALGWTSADLDTAFIEAKKL